MTGVSLLMVSPHENLQEFRRIIITFLHAGIGLLSFKWPNHMGLAVWVLSLPWRANKPFSLANNQLLFTRERNSSENIPTNMHQQVMPLETLSAVHFGEINAIHTPDYCIML